MVINGAPVDDSLVLRLARNIRSATLAHKLRAALRFRTELINLGNHERTLVLLGPESRFASRWVARRPTGARSALGVFGERRGRVLRRERQASSSSQLFPIAGITRVG